jgi:hypothetical protein
MKSLWKNIRRITQNRSQTLLSPYSPDETIAGDAPRLQRRITAKDPAGEQRAAVFGIHPMTMIRLSNGSCVGRFLKIHPPTIKQWTWRRCRTLRR